MLVDPEIASPFDLYPAQERFLREALTLTADGRLPYPELVLAAPKKSGKTATAALVVIYVVVVLGGPFAEAYCAANDLQQAAGRVFHAVVRILEASPRLRDAVKVTGGKVECLSTGAIITALANDYASAAGGNPNISSFDELWGYTSERARRLWDEMVPPPHAEDRDSADGHLCRVRGRVGATRGAPQARPSRHGDRGRRPVRSQGRGLRLPQYEALGPDQHERRWRPRQRRDHDHRPPLPRDLQALYGIRQESVRRAAMEKVETYVPSLSSGAPAERRGVA